MKSQTIVYNVKSPGDTYSARYTSVEELGRSEYKEHKNSFLIAAEVESESGLRSFALIKLKDGEVKRFENAYDKPCLLAAYHDRARAGGGRGIAEGVLEYLERIGVSKAL